MAHPPPGGPISTDVGEGLVIVTIGSTEGNLLYGLVHDEVLRQTGQTESDSPAHTVQTQVLQKASDYI